MDCFKCSEVGIKEHDIICSKCKVGGHHYCHGICVTSFSKISKNSKNKWTCNEWVESMSELISEIVKKIQMNKGKVTLETLTD